MCGYHSRLLQGLHAGEGVDGESGEARDHLKNEEK